MLFPVTRNVTPRCFLLSGCITCYRQHTAVITLQLTSFWDGVTFLGIRLIVHSLLVLSQPNQPVNTSTMVGRKSSFYDIFYQTLWLNIWFDQSVSCSLNILRNNIAIRLLARWFCIKRSFFFVHCSQLTVKSDVTTQYKILLQGLITTEQRLPDVVSHVGSAVQET